MKLNLANMTAQLGHDQRVTVVSNTSDVAKNANQTTKIPMKKILVSVKAVHTRTDSRSSLSPFKFVKSTLLSFIGAKAYWLKVDEEAIRREIYDNGPLEAAFSVYADFLNYKSGKTFMQH